MAPTATIAGWTQGELPEEYDALLKKYGDPFIQRKIDSVLMSLFGEVLDNAGQEALDIRLQDYIGKVVALELIGPGISYWSKQALGVGARGSNETKTYKDRAEDLKELQKQLLAKTREMYPEIQDLIPNRRVRRTPVGPRVRQVVGVVTSDPDNWEPAFGPPQNPPPGNVL